VSFVEQLERELKARRIRPPVRRRILLEYADHIASERESGAARLGDPGELAGPFAAEMATDDARRTTRNTFLALSATAVALVVGQLAIGHAGGYQGPGNGRSLALWTPAILAMLCAPQVALVTGLLAATRALVRRHAVVMPDVEVALIHRRCLSGAVAGMVTCAGILLYTVNFSAELSSWWVWTQAAMAAGAGVGLALAIRGSLRCRLTIGGTAGEPADLFDLAASRFGAIAPPRSLQSLRTLRSRPWAATALAAGLVVVATTLFTAHAERSLVEGLERGGFETVFIAAGLAIVRGLVWLRARRVRRGPAPAH
jgi:hypothetical protein